MQYLPFRLAGVVQCYIKANPTLQYVTWTKDKRLLEPYQTKDIVVMNNGSLLFTRVNENHQGRYTCTPYNAQGTQGSSGPMEVLVRNPPVFTLEPEPIYQKKVGETVEMHCDAQEAEGTQKPTIQWHRVCIAEKEYSTYCGIKFHSLERKHNRRRLTGYQESLYILNFSVAFRFVIGLVPRSCGGIKV